eukprot:3938845-Rhodomonas_salina.4
MMPFAFSIVTLWCNSNDAQSERRDVAPIVNLVCEERKLRPPRYMRATCGGWNWRGQVAHRFVAERTSSLGELAREVRGVVGRLGRQPRACAHHRRKPRRVHAGQGGRGSGPSGEDRGLRRRDGDRGRVGGEWR